MWNQAPWSTEKKQWSKRHLDYVKEIHLITLKHLPNGWGIAGTLSRVGGTGEHHFFCIPPPP